MQIQMTKILNVVLVCAALLSGRAWSQNLQRVEVFGGYSYLYYGVNSLQHTNMSGWEASLGYNFTQRLAIEADCSGNYGYDYAYHYGTFWSQNHFYLVGPRFNYKVLFGHALLGVGQSRSHTVFFGDEFPPSVSATAFAMALGGGVEKKIATHLAIRGGADWLFDHLDVADFFHPSVSPYHNSFRLNVGMVFMFGTRK
jgi:hypothetical protein